MATAYDQLVSQLYQEQLGREADTGGAAYWASQLAAGVSEADVAKAMSQSLEGQNLLTQAITSAYRSDLGRNPEQAGYQYWQSAAQTGGMSAQEIQDAVKAAAIAEQQQRGITGGFTNLSLADLEADPWAGRYATTSIYDLPGAADQINISYINGVPVQFVAPTTQQQYISNYGQAAWNAVAGDEVLSVPRVTEVVNRAYSAGSMTQQEYKTIIDSLAKAKAPEEIRQILGIPQGAVIIDPKYGQQIGEDNSLKLALAEAAKEVVEMWTQASKGNKLAQAASWLEYSKIVGQLAKALEQGNYG